LIALGEFNYDDFDDSGNGTLAWVIFIVSTLINCVVMLNLLIAIVSETFAIVVNEKIENSYREKASIIHENYFLLNEENRKSNLNAFEALIIIKPQTGKFINYDATMVADDKEDDEGNRQGVSAQAIIINNASFQN
jgi:hypothetical protein